jgi:hypothetical protein
MWELNTLSISQFGMVRLGDWARYIPEFMNWSLSVQSGGWAHVQEFKLAIAQTQKLSKVIGIDGLYYVS